MLYRHRTYHNVLVRCLRCSCRLDIDGRTEFAFPAFTHWLVIGPKQFSSANTSQRTPLVVIQYPSIDRLSTPPIDTSPPPLFAKDSPSNLHKSGNIDPNSIRNLYGARSIVFTSEQCAESNSIHDQAWKRFQPPLSYSPTGVPWKEDSSLPKPFRWMSQQIYHKLLIHFVPAQYPNSVQQPGYTYYASFGFIASVAGSASMVLSTQTLLCTMMTCATDEVHSPMTTTTVSAAAGALNWVLKDGIGQLGGIVVASYMGQLRSLDSNPKRYRMFAAILLDAAALVELSTPLGVLMISSAAVVPMACLATVCKNVGFIMASASRATIHQSLCIASRTNVTPHETSSPNSPAAIPNNLADVTAKFSSQSTAAGLLGTLLGIAMSTWIPVLGNSSDSSHFDCYSVVAILGLIFVHQSCNYFALRSVALYHLNRQRLCIILNHYFHRRSCGQHESKLNAVSKKVLTPMQVAEREYFLPPLFGFSTSSQMESTGINLDWLSIGCPLESICPKGSDQLMELIAACDCEQYIINVDADACNGQIQLVFFEQANGDDIIRGMLHAFALRDVLSNRPAFLESQLADCLLDEKVKIYRTHQWVQGIFISFVNELRATGWNTNTIFVEEGVKSSRLAVRF